MKQYRPVKDGEYPYLISRHLVVEQDGNRIGMDFDVYDCNTGDWHAMKHFANLCDLRLCELVEVDPAPLVPDEVVATIRGLLESAVASTESTIRGHKINGLRGFSVTEAEWLRRYQSALAWLDTLGGSDNES